MDPSLSAHRNSGLEGIDLNQFQGEINKLSSGVLRGIDGNSLQLIDHALLSPEYIANHFHNGLIVDLVSQSQEQPIESHHIYNPSIQNTNSPIQISNDRRFIVGSEPTTIHSALHQSIQHLENRSSFQGINDHRRVIIGEQERSFVSANEAPVIVSNKDAVGISSMEDIDLSTTFSSNFSQIEQTVLHDINKVSDATRNKNEEELLDDKTLPPLPPLTPISQMQSARRTPSIEHNHGNHFKVSKQHMYTIARNGSLPKNVCFLADEDEMNFIQSNVKFGRQASKEPSIGPKKNLPHKKRITKKLKNISPNEDQMHLQSSDLNYQTQFNGDMHHLHAHHEQSTLLSSGNVSLNLTMSSQPMQLTTNRVEQPVKQPTFITSAHFPSQSITPNPVHSVQMPILHFTYQICGVQIDEQYDFYTHLKLHYEPDKIVPQPENVKHCESSRIVRDTANDAVIESSFQTNSNIYHLSNDEHRKLSNETCIQSAQSETLPTQTVMNDSFNRMQNTEQDFNCISGIGTEDITDDDSMNDYNDSGLNAIKAEQNEFSDAEDMLENGVLDKVQLFIENDTSDVKNLMEMDEPSQRSSNLVENPCHWPATNNNNMVYNAIDKSVSTTEVIRDTNSYGMESSRHQKEVGRPEDLTLIYEINVNDKDFDGIGENSTESILRNQLLKPGGEVSVAVPNAFQTDMKITGKKTEKYLKQVKNAPADATDSIKLNIQDEFIEEERTDSDIDSGKPDAQKKKKKIYRCKRCNKLCNSKNALHYHFLSHTGERPHQCSECGKSFFASSALKVHKRLHSGDKPYTIYHCNRPFRQWGDLKYHIQSKHTKEKSHQCEFCGKDFARRYSLILHRRIHTGEKNYKCEFCDKEFRASSYLQVHRKIHTGEKPFVCEVCNKSFRVRGDLKRHANIHERNKAKDIKTDDVNNLSSSSTSTKNELFTIEENNSIQSRSTDTLDQLVSVIESTDDAFANTCADGSAKKRNFSQFEMEKSFSQIKFKRDPINVSAVIINYSNDQPSGSNRH